MDDTPLYKKPWFYITVWLVALLVIYGWQIARMGGIQASLVDILIDLACIFPMFLILWMAFFSQFVLPVRTFHDRQKLYDRLITYLFGGHGPAIFIRNGELIKREGEERKKGPGVLWLDSASGAVTRTAVAIKQTMGPGVHFIEKNEFIAGTVDLHIQSQSLGPKESDKPFEDKKEEQSDEEYNQVQDRRKQVSALTRDGIEIIPNISVSFRVDTGFPKDGQAGSWYGYRTGITKKDKENEEKDKESIRKAVMGEGIKPNISADSPRHRTTWNQLPVLLAVDVWREYVAKFTLDELFKPEQLVPPIPPQHPQPTEEEIDPLSQPIQVSANRETLQDMITGVLRQVNLLMNRMIRWLEHKNDDEINKNPLSETPVTTSADKNELQKKTALQVINEMVKARLTQAGVDILDDHGSREYGVINSPEFELVKNRGLKVINVSINNLRFHPSIDEEIIGHWEATWLKSAQSEKEQIERRRTILETAGQELAARKHATFLSQGLMKEKPTGTKAALKTLLMRSRIIIIKNDQLRRSMSTERQELEDILQWVENNE